MSDFQTKLYGVVLMFWGHVPEQNLPMPCQQKPLFFLGLGAVLLVNVVYLLGGHIFAFSPHQWMH
eukprot:1836669-Ditylum_brightwellii.AAC.1